MPLEHGDEFAGLKVPEANRAIPTRAGGEGAVGRGGEVEDFAFVAFQTRNVFSVIGLPEDRGEVVSGGKGKVAVG